MSGRGGSCDEARADWVVVGVGADAGATQCDAGDLLAVGFTLVFVVVVVVVLVVELDDGDGGVSDMRVSTGSTFGGMGIGRDEHGGVTVASSTGGAGLVGSAGEGVDKTGAEAARGGLNAETAIGTGTAMDIAEGAGG